MPATPDHRSAAREAHRRLARLAISWYDADPIQVEKILRKSHPDALALLDALVKAHVITPTQADQLHAGQAPTRVDPNAQAILHSNGAAVSPGEPTQMGPYRILRRLGEGGMGSVYLAFDGKANRQVAVKVLAAENAPRTNILQRFQQEGRHGAMMLHPNIVHSFDAGQDTATGLHYIVLEYVDGPSAHDLLDRTGPLKIGDAVHIILDIARALEYAHTSRIIHRDIKPSNILLTSTGVAKLSDMGLAKHRDDSANLTNHSQGIGTPYYMPYEQAINAKRADERCDIYALGATLYHLITGEVPFRGESSVEIVEKKGIGQYPPAREVVANVPDVLEDILAKMLARDPDDRYHTVSEVIVELERAQLADTIPSFVDRELAMKDPVVRQQWTAPVQPTSPDLNLQYAIANHPSSKDEQTWFLRYEDREGKLCKSKVTAAEILDRLSRGKLSPSTEASRTLQGEYRALGRWPEFRKAVASVRGRKKAKKQASAPVPERQVPAWWWIAVASVLGVGVIVILLATVFLFA